MHSSGSFNIDYRFSLTNCANTPCSIVVSQSSTFALSISPTSCLRRSFALAKISCLFTVGNRRNGVGPVWEVCVDGRSVDALEGTVTGTDCWKKSYVDRGGVCCMVSDPVACYCSTADALAVSEDGA